MKSYPHVLRESSLLAIIGVSIIPLYLIPAKLVSKKRYKITLDAQKTNDKVNQVLNETLTVSGQQLVKIFTNEEMERKRN